MWARLIGIAALAAVVAIGGAAAQEVKVEPLKIGLVLSMTGAFNTTGKAALNAARLYIQEHGDIVAGRRSSSSSRMTRPRRMSPSVSPRN